MIDPSNLIGGQGEKMQFHLVMGGPRSGAQIVAAKLVDSLNLQSDGSAVIMPWGRYKNWKAKFEYLLENFQFRLNDKLENNSEIQHVVIHGPGLIYNTFFSPTDLATIFPNTVKYFVKRESKAIESQLAADLVYDLEVYKFLRRSQDPRLEEFLATWNQMLTVFATKFDNVVEEYSFKDFGNFVVVDNVVNITAAIEEEDSDIRVANP